MGDNFPSLLVVSPGDPIESVKACESLSARKPLLLAYLRYGIARCLCILGNIASLSEKESASLGGFPVSDGFVPGVAFFGWEPCILVPHGIQGAGILWVLVVSKPPYNLSHEEELVFNRQQIPGNQEEVAQRSEMQKYHFSSWVLEVCCWPNANFSW